MSYIIKSQRIYSDRGLINGGILVDNDKIKKIITADDLIKYNNIDIIDYQNARVIPGIIEMHIHGYKGYNAMSPNKDEILNLAKAVTTCGITAFTPTNHYLPHIFENHQAIIEAMDTVNDGAKILGIHMEGPFISLERLGSVMPEEVVAPNLELMQKFYDTAQGRITTVTLAPEVSGNKAIIDFCIERGINVCLGHTNATFDEAKAAIDQGAIISQKTGNCMRPMHQRDLGVIGAVLLDQRVFNEINSDLRHTSADFLQLCYNLKGKDKLCIIADEGVMSGMPVGNYNLPDRGAYSVGEDFLLRDYRNVFDGSTKHSLFGISNWVEVIKIPMTEAVIMASLNPAKVLKIDHKKGSIKEKKDADIVIIDDAYEVIATYVEGKKVYDVKENKSYENPTYLNYIVK